MLNIIDTYADIGSAFDGGVFSRENWERYIEKAYPGCAALCVNDLNEALGCGCDYEKDILPVLNAVHEHPALNELHASFVSVTSGLNERIADTFGKTLDADIILYVGLCGGAGWATAINGRDVILLGIEKISELGWYDEKAMYGLIYHELGHLYHKQHGRYIERPDGPDGFIWQLFSEGVAMCFEQTLMGDASFFHQDTDGWAAWCARELARLSADFLADLPVMTRADQRYFGDRVYWNGKSDTGYYLGARFVRYLLAERTFDEVIRMDEDSIRRGYLDFAERSINQEV